MLQSRLLVAVLSLALCGCTGFDGGDGMAASLPAELEQFRAADGLLMVPQLLDRTVDVPTTVFALELRRLAGRTSEVRPDPAELTELRNGRSGEGVVRDAWYLSMLEDHLAAPVVDGPLVQEVRASQRPSGWFFATRPAEPNAEPDLPALIDESSKAVAVLAERGADLGWRARLRAVAQGTDAAALPVFSRWQLEKLAEKPADSNALASSAPAPPTQLSEEAAACLSLAGHLGLGGKISPEMIGAWAQWLAGPRPIGLMTLVSEALLPVATAAQARQINSAALSRLAPLELPGGVFAADGEVVGDLKATFFMQTLSRLGGRPFSDAALAAALDAYELGPQQGLAAEWTAAVRTRVLALATDVPGGTDATQLAWIGGTDEAAARQLPDLALLAVDMGVAVPRPVVPDLSRLAPGPAAHAAVADWVAHSEAPRTREALVSEWEDLVRAGPKDSYREYFHAATAVLVTEGVTEETQWIVDDGRARIAEGGRCRGVDFLVAERAGSKVCDLQASTAAFLFTLAVGAGEVIAEVRS